MRSKIREIDIRSTDRVAFIHIPKTAGITFSTILHPLLAGLPWCPAILPQDLIQIPYEEISQYQLFTGHFYLRLLNKLFPSGCLFMTFLREPISRTISHYEYLIRQETFGKFDYANTELTLAKKMSLIEFVSNNQLHIALDVTDLQTKFLGGAVDSKAPIAEEKTEPSIEEYIQKASKEMNLEPIPVEEYRFANKENLEKAKRELEQAAFFGITERFQDSLFLMSFTFGWIPVLDSLRLNHKLKTEYTQEPERETLELIKSKVSLDLELYQFGQTLFEQRFKDMTDTLIHRYGNKVHAKLRSPLPADLMVQFLEQNYLDRRDRRAQQEDVPDDKYLYQPGSKVEGAFGWYSPDFSPEHGRACWSGPGLLSGFDLPCPNGINIRVSFRILMVLQPVIIEQLLLTVNNLPVTLGHSVDPDGAFVFTGEISPAAVSGSFLRVVFSVPVTIVPGTVDPDNRDPRRLGILLNWVKLQAD